MVLLDPASWHPLFGVAVPELERPDPGIVVYVHPIDREKHHTTPPGYRWAVMLRGSDPVDYARCLNAGWSPTKAEAAMEGEAVGIAVHRVLALFIAHARYDIEHLPFDPIPAGVQ